MLSLAEALAAMPDTADGIADRLAELGIRGARKDDFCCPIANYLKRTANVVDPAVDAGFVEGLVENGEEVVCGTSEAVADFVLRFDLGAWPELVDEPEDDDA